MIVRSAFCLYIWPFWTFSMNRIIQYVVFYGWLLSWSMVLQRFIYAVAWYFIPFYGWIILYRFTTVLFIPSWVNECLVWFHILAISLLLLWIFLYKFLCGYIFSSCGYIPRVELLGCVVILCLAFWGTARLFSKLIAPFCIRTSNALRLQFLHILDNTCDCLSFWF